MNAPAPIHGGTAVEGSLAAAIAPKLDEIAKRAQVTEDLRRIPDENIEALREAGFVRALLPKVLGGDQRDLWDFCQGVRAVAKACPSTGWVAGVQNIHQAAYTLFPKHIQEKLIENGPDTISSSSGSPQMKAKLVEGGISLTGVGRWSSGCHHAEWAMIGVRVPTASDPKYPENSYRDYMFWAHKSEYEIEDVWHVSGMAGTGSNNLVFKELFVAWDRLERSDALSFLYSRGVGSVDCWMNRVPLPAPFMTFMPAVVLGCVDGAIEQFALRQVKRKNAYTQAQGALNPAGHMAIGEAKHALACLESYLRDHVNKVQEFGEKGTKLRHEQQFHDLTAPSAYVAKEGYKIIDRLVEAAGASAMAKFNPLQRYWRDAKTASLHTAMDYQTQVQHYGRCILGVQPTPDL